MAESSASSLPPQYRPIGISLAISSGMLIGSSFVFKKKGLLSSQKGKVAGEGVAYLKSPMWWTGMVIMILGELCNFAAYAFVEAIIVTPMGALSVVICAILSHFILKEKLSLFGWIGSIQCILGASILALNAPHEPSVSDIAEFKKLFLAPGFLSYGSVVIALAVFLVVIVAPRWGHKTMMPYIGVCSLIGGLSVSCTQGLGACILTSIRGENQFKNWFIYFVLVFVVITLLTEVYYLNVALAMFNTAMVTPTYYVTFTFCTLVTSIILYQGLKASGAVILTVILAFLVICTGITILQMSKVDPRKLTNVDDRTTLLLEAAKQEVDPKSSREIQRVARVSSRPSCHSSRRRVRTASTQSRPPPLPRLASPLPRQESVQPDPSLDGSPFYTDDDENYSDEDERAIMEKTEEPGIDSLRGTFGAVGTIIRARRRATALSEAKNRKRPSIPGEGRARGFSSSTGEGLSVNSPRGSIATEVREGNGADLDLEKADLRRQYFGSGRIHKVSTTSNEPLITRPLPVLRRPDISPDKVFVDEPQEFAESPESTPPASEGLRQTPGLHAHFGANDTIGRSRTLPTVIPSMEKENRDL